MAPPSPPLASPLANRLRPVAKNGALQFWWGPPTDDGGSQISYYTISNGDDITFAGITTVPYTISGLTNNTPYSFYITATNTNNETSTPAYFRTVRPGDRPAAPTNASRTMLSADTVQVSWTPPTVSGDVAELLGTVLTTYPLDGSGNIITDPAVDIPRSVPAGASTWNVQLPQGLSYKTLIRAVNDPGYSPKTLYTSAYSTGDISDSVILLSYNIIPYNSIFPYSVYYNGIMSPIVDGNAYIPKTTWTIVTSVTQTIYGFLVLLSDGFGNYIFIIITKGGVIIYTSPSFTSDETPRVMGRTYRRIVVASIQSGTVKFQLWDFVSLAASSYTVTDALSLNAAPTINQNLFDDKVLFTLQMTDNSFRVYMFKDTNSTPTTLFTGAAGFSYSCDFYNSNMAFVASNSDNSLYPTLCLVPNNGTARIYDISGYNITTVSSFYAVTPYRAVLLDTTSNVYTFDMSTSTLALDLSGTFTAAPSTDVTHISSYNGSIGTLSILALGGGYGEVYRVFGGTAFGTSVGNQQPHIVAGSNVASASMFDTVTSEIFLSVIDSSGNYADVSMNVGISNSDTAALKGYPKYTLTRHYQSSTNPGGIYTLFQAEAGSNVYSLVTDVGDDFITSPKSTDNQDVNFIIGSLGNTIMTVPGTAPVLLPITYDNAYSLYPSTSRTLLSRLPNFDIYNGSTLDVSGITLSSFDYTAQNVQVFKLNDGWIVSSVGSNGVQLGRISSTGSTTTFTDPTNTGSSINVAVIANNSVCISTDSGIAYVDYYYSSLTDSFTSFSKGQTPTKYTTYAPSFAFSV